MKVSRAMWVKIAVPVFLAGILSTVVAFRSPEPHAATSQGEWTCSMHPQVRQARPGQCPICGMNLVPVSKLAEEQGEIKQRAGVETEPVAYRELFKEIRTVGKLDYNERQVAFITARVPGRVDRVFADFTGIQVQKNDHLVDIYSPELVVTVQNLVDAVKSGNQSLADIGRERLRLWGILPDQIQEIEKSGKWKPHLTINAPIGGTVVEKAVREGQYVKEGDMLYRIANLDPIWLYLDVYEYDLGWVRFGQRVEVTVEAYPGQAFHGTVTFIDPFLDDKTRTVKARVNLKNPDRRLRPAMYASAVIRVRLRSDGTPEPTGLEGKYICPMHPEVVKDQAGRCSICGMTLERVPEPRPPAHATHEGHEPAGGHRQIAGIEAGKVLAVRAASVLDTGRRKVVYRLRDGVYELVDLRTGPRAEGSGEGGEKVGYYPVLAGLKAGDRVVVRGAFLLDSQRQIEGMPSLLYPEGQSAANLHAGHGGTAPAPKTTADGGTHKH